MYMPIVSKDLNPPTLVLLVDGNKTTIGGVETLNESLMTSTLTRRFCFKRSSWLDLFQRLLIKPQCKFPKAIIIDIALSWRALPLLIAARAFCYLRCTRCKLLSREHHYSRGFVENQVSHRTRFYQLLRLSYSVFDRVISISEAQQNWILERQLATAPKVQLLHQAGDIENLLSLPLPNFGKDETSLVFGAIGRFNKQKGFDLLIKAWEKLSTCRDMIQLHLAGSGEDYPYLKELAKSSRTIHFLGEITDRPAFYGGCDVIIIPSRWEPFGQVCLEARASGRPLIVADVDGLPEQIQGNQELALSFESGSVDDLTFAIERTVAVLSSNNPKLTCISHQIRQSAAEAYSTFLKDLSKTLDELISSE
jgi:glycosyltransferase involved in cell wall biosynthesis